MSGLHASRAPAALGGDFSASDPTEQSGLGFCDALTWAFMLGAERSRPTQVLPAPWEGNVVRPLGREAGRHGPFYTPTGIPLFLTVCQGKA